MAHTQASFMGKVSIVPITGCWMWMQTISYRGYGLAEIKGRTTTAHRLAHILFKGPIGDGLQVDHLCRNTWCVNPAHLEAVTPRENTMRGNTVSAINARKTHCQRGHPYDEENTYYDGRGRDCRECTRISQRKARKWKMDRGIPTKTRGIRTVPALSTQHLPLKVAAPGVDGTP